MDEPPTKRFRFATYNEQINNLELDDGKGKGRAWEEDVDEDSSVTPFNSELERLAILDLTVPFQDLYRQLRPLSTNLPITLLNLSTINGLFHKLYDGIVPQQDHTHSGLDSALQAHRALFQTCLGEAISTLPSTARQSMRMGAIPGLEPKLVERTYSTLSLVLRDLAGAILQADDQSQAIVRDLWQDAAGYLDPKTNKPHVRQCVTNAWVGVIRKARGESLARLMTLIFDTQRGSKTEALWAESMKGTTSNLHSRALLIFDRLLDDLAANPTEAPIASMSKIVTAVVHHCSSRSLEPVVDAILERLQTTQASSPTTSKLTTIPLLHLLSTTLLVRKGKRFPHSRLKVAMQVLLQITSTPPALVSNVDASENALLKAWKAEVAAAVIGTLMVGKLAEWLSPGVALLDNVCKLLDNYELMAVSRVLLQSEWPGSTQFLLPRILKNLDETFEERPLEALDMLDVLLKTDVIPASAWKTYNGGKWHSVLLDKLGRKLQELVDNTMRKEEDRLVLLRILMLLPEIDSNPSSNLPIVSRYVTHLVQDLSNGTEDQARQAWVDEGPCNQAHMLAVAMKYLDRSTSRQQESSSGTMATHEAESIWRNYSWNREIMEIMSASCSTDPSLDASANLLSNDPVLRLAALKIAKASATSPWLKETWRLGEQVEEAEMTLKNVRERSTRIRRLVRHIISQEDEERVIDSATLRGVINYLLAQLKLNYRPIYAETVSSLAEIASSHGEVVWSAIWDELLKLGSSKSVHVVDFGVEDPPWASSALDESETASVPNPGDGDLVCHSLHESRNVFDVAWNRDDLSRIVERDQIHSQVQSDRLDVLNYESQLLATLVAVPSIAERHTRLLVPHFLQMVNKHGSDDPENQIGTFLSTRQRQQRTQRYLEVFAKFANPKAAFQSDGLHRLYESLLSIGDNALQGLALTCLMTYKSPKLLPYEDRLKDLLDGHKFRDALLHFPLSIESEAINPEHRDELISVAIRLLYGILTSRQGRGSTVRNVSARRQAILTAINGCSESELQTLVDLMLRVISDKEDALAVADGSSMDRQKVGFLSLLTEVLRHLARNLTPHLPSLVDAVIRLLSEAQASITSTDPSLEHSRINDEIADGDEETDGKTESSLSVVRTIRTAAVRRLTDLIRLPLDFGISSYVPSIFECAISPRLEHFEIENSQAPSATLDMIAVVAARPDLAHFLTECDSRTLPKVFACLTAVKVKPTVILRVFDIVDSLLAQSEEESTTTLVSHLEPLLSNLIGLTSTHQITKNDQLLPRMLSILSQLSNLVSDGEQAQQLASLLVPMLRETNSKVSEKSKTAILATMSHVYWLCPDFSQVESDFFQHQYTAIANLFQHLRGPPARKALVAVYQEFAKQDLALESIFDLISNLNAYSKKRLEEPDFDRRLAAFSQINEMETTSLPSNMREWLPLVRTALFLIRDQDELSIRTNASMILRRFIDVVENRKTADLRDAISSVLLPALRQLLKSKAEPVRQEALIVLSHAIDTLPEIPSLGEMQSLVSEDDETSFFLNISHIQVHRRARALRRLRDAVDQAQYAENTIWNIFLPLLEHIIAGSTEVTDHHLVNEAVLTIGAMAGCLRWPKYSSLLMRYIRSGSVQTAQQKAYIRVVSAIIDNFHFNTTAPSQENLEPNGDDYDDEVDPDVDEEPIILPNEISEKGNATTHVIMQSLLPQLAKFLDMRDGAKEDVRIPLALSTVKLANALPGKLSQVEVLRVITNTSQILRSKDQDTRDVARDTICKVAVYLGPTWLRRVLAELRTALQRGPQKHVAAVTTHSILSMATNDASDRFSDLDEAIEDVVTITSEVIWGESGRDATSEGFMTKMREVKGAMSRGFDTFQLLSRLASPTKLSVILAPIQDVLHGSQATTALHHVDEALRRIALGLNANTRIGPQDLLNLVHALVTDNSSYTKRKRLDQPVSTIQKSYQVQMKRRDKLEEDFFGQNAHKLKSFGLDLFVTAFRRGKLNFQDLEVLGRLAGLVHPIGDTLYSKESDVQILGLKACAAIARCPLPQLDEALPVIISNIFRILRNNSGTSESELAQTVLKTLAVIVRDCPNSKISDGQLRYILEILSPDIEEHDRQNGAFAILRAIVSRKFVVPEIYDLLDRISSIMVTSQSSHVQETCRGILLQFLLDYPQGKGRLKSQLTFLAQNLNYEYESGRLSVMEILSAVFDKFSDEIIEQSADLFFVALTAVLANDDSERCRTAAGALIRQLFARSDLNHQTRFVDVLEDWASKSDDQTELARASLAVISLLCATPKSEEGNESLSRRAVTIAGPLVKRSAARLESVQRGDLGKPLLDYQIAHHAMTILNKNLGVKTTADIVPNDVMQAVVVHLDYSHDWVRSAALKTLTSFLQLIVAMSQLPLDLLDIAHRTCRILAPDQGNDHGPVTVDTQLADQSVKVLWILAKHWAKSDDDLDGGMSEDEPADARTQGNPLSWLMSRMSFIARNIVINRPSLHSTAAELDWTPPLLSILRFFAGVYDILDMDQAKHFLPHVLNPLYRILDEGGDLSTVGGDVAELRQLAVEVRDAVQQKVGTTDFAQMWDKLRRQVSEKRQDRRDAKNRLATTNSEVWAAKKGKRVVLKKASKQRKVMAFKERGLGASGRRKTGQ